MRNPLANPCNLAALEAIRNQISHLEEIIASLIALMKSLPDGEAREKLFNEISALDSIADVIRQALDSMHTEEY
jgi:hypothetical protein